MHRETVTQTEMMLAEELWIIMVNDKQDSQNSAVEVFRFDGLSAWLNQLSCKRKKRFHQTSVNFPTLIRLAAFEHRRDKNAVSHKSQPREHESLEVHRLQD